MKPEYKIIGFADKECRKPVVCIKTFNPMVLGYDNAGVGKWTKTTAWQKQINDKSGTEVKKVEKVCFFIRKRPAFGTRKEYLEWKKLENDRLQAIAEKNHSKIAKVRHRWEEITVPEPSVFKKIVGLLRPKKAVKAK